MIFDCFTHIWDSPDQLGRCIPHRRDELVEQKALDLATAGSAQRHLDAAQPVTTTFVVGFKSRYLDSEIPNERIVSYVKDHPGKLIGFAGIDPSTPTFAIDELHRVSLDLAIGGVAVAPAAQDYHPTNSQAMTVYAEAEMLELPMIFHTGIFLAREAKLEYARPILLDEIAREFPKLKIIVAHMGYPWVADCVALLGKHPNVYAETSWLTGKPWQAYQAMVMAYEHGVIDKLFFGSGFPRRSVSQAVEELYDINHIPNGANLPTVPREHLRGIVERDAPSILGIRRQTNAPTTVDP